MTKGLNYTFQTEHYTWPRLGLVYLKQIEVITSTSTSHLKVDFGEKARNAANAFSKIRGLAFVIMAGSVLFYPKIFLEKLVKP